jgi:hypothetical protein
MFPRHSTSLPVRVCASRGGTVPREANGDRRLGANSGASQVLPVAGDDGLTPRCPGRAATPACRAAPVRALSVLCPMPLVRGAVDAILSSQHHLRREAIQ